MYIYMRKYIGLTRCVCMCICGWSVRESERGVGFTRTLIPSWPLQDIVLLLVVCARINRLFILTAHLHCPHYFHTIARLLRNIRRAPDPTFVCHTPYNIGNGNTV